MFWKQEPKNNPFNFREPVYEQDSFFGREQEVRSLIDFMRVGQSVAIQGPAKIGKTSLLKYVSSSVVLAENGFDPANFVGVYINCTDLENKDLTQCFRYLGQQINQRVKQVTSKSITYGNSFTGLRRGIQEHEDQGLRTILILDNFDALSCNPYITHTFLLNLRALDQEHASSLSYLVASEGNLAELERTQFTGNGTNGSPFANVFALLPLGSLSPEGSQELLEKQLAKVEPPLLQPDPETLQKITEAYKAQEPYRLQWLGWQLVAAWHNRLEMDEDIYGKPLAQSLRQLPYLNLDGIEQADASLPLANRLLRFYPLLVIIIGVAAAIYLAGRLLGPTGQWTVYTLGSAAAALGLFILSDSRPLVFQDTQISLGFLVILIFLLLPEKYVNRPDVHTWLAALIPVIGALLSEPLHQRQQPVIPSPYAIQRVFFYAAQHAVVALLSSLIYLQATHWEWGQTILNNIRLPALPVNVLVYAIAYAILSPIIMAPYDYTIRHLLRPANETFLPRLNLWILLLLAPMPITLAFFFTGGQSWVFVVLALLLLFFIMLAGTYPNIEGNRNRLQTLSETTQALGTPHSMNALGKQLQHMLDARVDYAWGAIYATRADESEGSGKRHYFLRATLEKTEAGSSLSNYDPRLSDKGRLIAATAEQPFSQTVHWPAVVTPKEAGHLSHLVQTGQPSPLIKGDGSLLDSDSAVYLPAHLYALYFPIQDKQMPPNGLLALTAGRPFTHETQQYAALLAGPAAKPLQYILANESKIRKLYADVENYSPDSDAFQKTVQELDGKGVDVFLILDLIMQATFRNDVLSVMREFTDQPKPAQQTSIQMSKDDLRDIYRQARDRNHKMPRLDDEILESLQKLPTSLSVAFSFRYQWPQVRRGPEFEPLYEFLVLGMQAKTVDDIINLVKEGEPAKTIATLNRQAFLHREILEQLKELQDMMEQFQHKSPDKMLEAINQFKSQLRQYLTDPERFLFHKLLEHWDSIAYMPIAEQERVSTRSEARLEISLCNREALLLPQNTIGISVTNQGPGDAYQLRVELRQSVHYQIIGQAQIEQRWLAPHKTTEMLFHIKLEKVANIKVEFDIGYRDRKMQTQSFKESITILPPPPPYTLVKNPYALGRPLEIGEETFVGRKDIVDTINELISDDTNRQPVLLLTGERRVGKTSLLKRLPAFVTNQQYIHILFDCQRLPDQLNANIFFRRLAEEIQLVLQDQHIIESIGEQLWQQDAALTFERHFLERVWQAAGSSLLLIAIDEFDRLDKTLAQDVDFVTQLRGLMQSQPRLTFIFSSARLLDKLNKKWSSRLNMGQQIKVGLLTQAEAEHLITQPVKGSRVYDPLALREILASTGCHPFFTQLICNRLMNACAVHQRSCVTIQHVQQALAHILDTLPNHLTDLWQSLDQTERAVLGGLAKSCLRDTESTTSETIKEHLTQAGLAYSQVAIREALKRLESERQIVRRQGVQGTGYYRFTMKLYQQWIQKYHALD